MIPRTLRNHHPRLAATLATPAPRAHSIATPQLRLSAVVRQLSTSSASSSSPMADGTSGSGKPSGGGDELPVGSPFSLACDGSYSKRKWVHNTERVADKISKPPSSSPSGYSNSTHRIHCDCPPAASCSHYPYPYDACRAGRGLRCYFAQTREASRGRSYSIDPPN